MDVEITVARPNKVMFEDYNVFDLGSHASTGAMGLGDERFSIVMGEELELGDDEYDPGTHDPIQYDAEYLVELRERAEIVVRALFPEGEHWVVVFRGGTFVALNADFVTHPPIPFSYRTDWECLMSGCLASKEAYANVHRGNALWWNQFVASLSSEEERKVCAAAMASLGGHPYPLPGDPSSASNTELIFSFPRPESDDWHYSAIVRFATDTTLQSLVHLPKLPPGSCPDQFPTPDASGSPSTRFFESVAAAAALEPRRHDAICPRILSIIHIEHDEHDE